MKEPSIASQPNADLTLPQPYASATPHVVVVRDACRGAADHVGTIFPDGPPLNVALGVWTSLN